jgi:CheY-like chemotaxis protein
MPPLPLLQSPDAGDPSPGGTKPARLRVLVVDDHRDAAESLARFVTLLGHEARTAGDGHAALDIAEEYRPELVLCDIGLPGIDGHEVARRLRAAYQDTMRLVAVTGHGRDEDFERSRESGFDEHVVKPVDPDMLRRLLERR